MLSLLSIAATDCSGGAGLLADVQTFHRCGHFAQGVVTAITAQNTHGIRSVTPTPVPLMMDQLAAVFDDIPIAAVKIGLLPTAQHILAITHFLEKYNIPIVVDPVLSASSGHSFHDAIDAYQILLAIATVSTPNQNEARRIFGDNPPPYTTLITGGDSTGDIITDTLHQPGQPPETFRATRVNGASPHGTGCLLSSLLACQLGQGKPLTTAVRNALAQTQKTIKNAHRLGATTNPAMAIIPTAID